MYEGSFTVNKNRIPSNGLYQIQFNFSELPFLAG
jgi:hypothetical protein